MGPFKNTKVFTPNIEISELDGSKSTMVHINWLKPFVSQASAPKSVHLEPARSKLHTQQEILVDNQRYNLRSRRK